jgi:ribose-phosphate pyrophosphokinase
MIKLTAETGLSHVLKPTMFPDGTSQVWKLPDEILESRELEITWNFESEREMIDLLSLRRLLSTQAVDLHIPFLPYARQDKEVSNSSTFNLVVLAELINSLGCRSVTSVDVHNPVVTAELIKNFQNVPVNELINRVVIEIDADYVVYPDKGAFVRYGDRKYGINQCAQEIICEKVRDQSTGDITGHRVISISCPLTRGYLNTILIVDDLCDGGATFISVAKLLREQQNVGKINLFVTHGVFSKGREHLLNNGISNIYTTNSLTKNVEGYQV